MMSNKTNTTDVNGDYLYLGDVVRCFSSSSVFEVVFCDNAFRKKYENFDGCDYPILEPENKDNRFAIIIHRGKREGDYEPTIEDLCRMIQNQSVLIEGLQKEVRANDEALVIINEKLIKIQSSADSASVNSRMVRKNFSRAFDRALEKINAGAKQIKEVESEAISQNWEDALSQNNYKSSNIGAVSDYTEGKIGGKND
jgi:hypothetical protein